LKKNTDSNAADKKYKDAAVSNINSYTESDASCREAITSHRSYKFEQSFVLTELYLSATNNHMKVKNIKRKSSD
jgi:hypothetical protein